jgi:oligopeptide/dipeptide ABC transporter ATP-binding protein
VSARSDRPTAGANAIATDALIAVADVVKHYPVQAGLALRSREVVHAVNGVSLQLARGETLGIIGESGSGKSTLGRLILGLERPTSGHVSFAGRDLAGRSASEMRHLRRDIGVVFQNPYSSVNRRRRVLAIVREPLEAHGIADRRGRDRQAQEALRLAGLPSGLEHRVASQLSGGQLQRVAVARAIVTSPQLLLADEPTASLDVSVRAQLVNLFEDLQRQLGMALVVISHDLATVSYLAERLLVMYLGRIVEQGPTSAIERDPLHPYTKALVASVPSTERRAQPAAPPRGEIPSAIHPPSGCAYHPRCPLAMSRCAAETPPLRPLGAGRWAACWALPSPNPSPLVSTSQSDGASTSTT